MNQDSVFSLLPETVEQKNEFVELMKETEIAPIKLWVQINLLEKMLKEIKDNIKEEVLNEASKYSEKSFELYGAKLSIKETGVKYDFTQCNDVIFNNLKQSNTELSEKIKARERLLKCVTQKTTWIDEETGEAFEVFPPSKSSTTTLQVEL